jgi:hypothetical protein
MRGSPGLDGFLGVTISASSRILMTGDKINGSSAIVV